MYQFFVQDENVGTEQICITGSDVNHIGNVLRMKPGEKFESAVSRAKHIFAIL